MFCLCSLFLKAFADLCIFAPLLVSSSYLYVRPGAACANPVTASNLHLNSARHHYPHALHLVHPSTPPSSPQEFYPGYLKTPRLVPPHSEPDDPSFDAITRALNASIRDLHRVVGNARDDDKYLVIGDGGVQLIDASLWALTQGDNVNKSMHVFAQPVR